MLLFRKIFSVIFYVLGGFMIFTANNIASIDPTAGHKAKDPQLITNSMQEVVVIILAIGAGLILVGGLITLFKGFRRGAGITMITAGSVALFMVLTFVCMALSPEMMKSIPNFNFAIYGNYPRGISLAAVELVFGIALLYKAKNPPLAVLS